MVFKLGEELGCDEAEAKQQNTGLVHCISKVSPRRRLEADGSDLVKTALTETKTLTGPKLGQD